MEIGGDGVYQTSVNSTTQGQFNQTITENKGTLEFTVPKDAIGGGNLTYTANLIDETKQSYENEIAIDRENVTVPSQLTVENFSVPDTAYTEAKFNVTVNVTNPTTSDQYFSVETTESGKIERGRQILVAAGSTKQVTLSTRQWETGTYEYRVNDEASQTVEVKSPINVTDYTVSTTKVKTNQNVTVTATVRNRRDTSITHRVEVTRFYRSGAHTYASKEVTFASGETKDVKFNLTFGYEGDKTITVGNRANTTIHVEENPIQTLDATVENQNLSKGETTQVNVSLTNYGQERTSKVLELQQGTNVLAVKNVSIDGESSKQVSFETAFSKTGAYEVEVNNDHGERVYISNPDVTITNISTSSSTVYRGEPVATTVTLKNDGTNEVTHVVTGWLDEHSRTKSVTIPAGGTQDVNFDLYGGDVGTKNITVNQKQGPEVTIKKAVKRVDYSLSSETVGVGEELRISVTLDNPTSKDRDRYVSIWAGGKSLSKRVSVPAGTTKTYTATRTFDSSGSKYLFVDGSRERVAVASDTTGTANLSVSEFSVPETAVNDTESWFFGRVKNTGNATGVRNYTLEIGGKVVDSEKVVVDPGETSSVFFSHTFDTKGDYTITLNGTTKQTRTVSVRGPVVISDSISVATVGGQEPVQNPTVKAQYYGGYIGFRITNDDGGRDLSKIGATRTTRFRINLTVQNFDPRILMTSGSRVSWETHPNPDPNRTNLTIYVQPSQLDYKTSFKNGRPQAPSEWDAKVQNDSADFSWDSAILMGIGNAKGEFVDADPSDVAGMTIATDAQMFRMPTYRSGTDGQSPRLEIPLAAPHLTAQQNLNTGYYRAHIPQSLLDEWNVTDPEAQLAGNYSADSSTSMKITELSDGARVELSLHYSSGVVSISRQLQTEDSSGGSSGTGSTGGSVQESNDEADDKTTKSTTVTDSSTTTSIEKTTTSTVDATTESPTTGETTTEFTTNETTTVRGGENGTPGFGVGVTLAALVAGTFLALRRSG